MTEKGQPKPDADLFSRTGASTAAANLKLPDIKALEAQLQLSVRGINERLQSLDQSRLVSQELLDTVVRL